MPTVHDDGGEQLNGKGVGIISVGSLVDPDGNRITLDEHVYLPFKNFDIIINDTHVPKLEIGQRVEIDICEADVEELGGKIRYAKITRLSDLELDDEKTARMRQYRLLVDHKIGQSNC